MPSKGNTYLAFCFITIIGLATHSVLLRMGFNLPAIFFWILVILTISLITLLIIDTNNKNSNVILCFIILVAWILKSLYIPRSDVPFFGSDSFLSFEATKLIFKNGWFGVPPWSENFQINLAHQLNYPFVPGISIALTTLSRLPLEIWARWGVITISLLSTIMVYELARFKFRSLNISLLSAFGFVFTYYYLMFHSQYLYESFAFLLFLTAIYALERSNYDHTTIWRAIALLSTVLLVFTHHLTSFLFILFVFLYYLVSLVLNWSISGKESGNKSNRTFLLFSVVCILSYWIYLKYSPLQIGITFLEDAFRDTSLIPQYPISFVPGLRLKVSLLFQAVSAIGFGLLALYIIRRDNIHSRDDIYQWKITSVIWGIGLGILSILGIIGLLGDFNSFPSRMEIFGYTFLIPVAASILNYPIGKQKMIKFSVALLFILHASGSMLRIAPYLYSNVKPELASGEVRSQWLEDEYNLVSRTQPDTHGIYGYTFRRLGNVYIPAARYITDPIAQEDLISNEFDYLLIGEMDQYAQSPDIAHLLETSKLNKIYDSGFTEVFIPAFTSNWGIETIFSPEVTTNDRPLLNRNNGAILLSAVCALVLIFIISWIISELLRYIMNKGVHYYDEQNEFDILGIIASLACFFFSFLLYDYFDQQIFFLFTIPIVIMCIYFLLVIKNKRLQDSARSTKIPILGICGLALFTLIIGTFFQLISEPNNFEHYTEYYLKNIELESNFGVLNSTVMLSNQEGHEMEYEIEIWFDKTFLFRTTKIELPSGNNHSIDLSIPLTNNSVNGKTLIMKLNKDIETGADQSLLLQLIP